MPKESNHEPCNDSLAIRIDKIELFELEEEQILANAFMSANMF